MGHLFRNSVEPICLSLRNYLGRTVRCVFHFKEEEFHGCYLFGVRGPKGCRRDESRKFYFLTYNLLDLEGLNREKNFRFNICLRRIIGFLMIPFALLWLVITGLAKVGIDWKLIVRIISGD